MMLEKDEDLTERLSDADPLIRWVVVQAVGRKRVPAEAQLIGLLSDSHGRVREAARLALVQVAGGTDFGPSPNATPVQRSQAIQAWRAWLALQNTAATDPGSPGNN
ncbi:MAG: HEAT repeat domain-containing protein [Planctomycetes bacterium]|nr:HEAT repeat domain-containing protein [Planctomycetota bacterium]